jgi:hypothetical protein
VLAGLTADAFGIPPAMWLVAGITLASPAEFPRELQRDLSPPDDLTHRA